MSDRRAHYKGVYWSLPDLLKVARPPGAVERRPLRPVDAEVGDPSNRAPECSFAVKASSRPSVRVSRPLPGLQSFSSPSDKETCPSLTTTWRQADVEQRRQRTNSPPLTISSYSRVARLLHEVHILETPTGILPGGLLAVTTSFPHGPFAFIFASAAVFPCASISLPVATVLLGAKSFGRRFAFAGEGEG